MQAIIGSIDVCNRTVLAGWAADPEQEGQTVRLHILQDGLFVKEVFARNFRADLQHISAQGNCAFEWVWQKALPHEGCQIDVINPDNGYPLPGSPVYIAPNASEVTGKIDVADHGRIAGWARDNLHPDRTVWLTLEIDSVVVRRFPANQFRRDLRDAGLGRGFYGFDYTFSHFLDPSKEHVIRLRHGRENFSDPRFIVHSSSLDDPLKSYIVALLQGVKSDEGRSDALRFFMKISEDLREREVRKIVNVSEENLSAQQKEEGQIQAAQSSIVLFIDDCAPDPTRDAGSIAIFSHMHVIQKLGYTCFFIASLRPLSEDDRIRLEKSNIVCLMPPTFGGPEDALKALGTRLSAVYLHRLSNAENYISLVRTFSPFAKIIWSVADLVSLRLKRQAVVEKRPELVEAGRRLAVRENMIAWQADALITHSAIEAAHIKNSVKNSNVFVIPWDVPIKKIRKRKVSEPIIAFVAHFAHAPNIDAAKWLVFEIMPILRAQIPGLRCRLIGSAIPHEVSLLAADDIEVSGYVENLASVLTDVALCVAPLRYGAGIKGKVLTAWSVGLPVVMTSIAAEGLIEASDIPWVDAIADDAKTFSEKIIRLLNKKCAQQQIKAALVLLTSRFSDAAIKDGIVKILPDISHCDDHFVSNRQ